MVHRASWHVRSPPHGWREGGRPARRVRPCVSRTRPPGRAAEPPRHRSRCRMSLVAVRGAAPWPCAAQPAYLSLLHVAHVKGLGGVLWVIAGQRERRSGAARDACEPRCPKKGIVNLWHCAFVWLILMVVFVLKWKLNPAAGRRARRAVVSRFTCMIVRCTQMTASDPDV